MNLPYEYKMAIEALDKLNDLFEKQCIGSESFRPFSVETNGTDWRITIFAVVLFATDKEDGDTFETAPVFEVIHYRARQFIKCIKNVRL